MGMAALLSCYIMRPLIWGKAPIVNGPHWIFTGWDGLTLLALLVSLIKLWLSGLIAKLLNSVVKQLGSCAAMLLTYILQQSLPFPWGNASEGGFNSATLMAMVS